MWMIRWFFLALILLISILFVTKNGDLEKISIDFVFFKTEEMTPLVLLFLSYAAGFLTWFVISIFNFTKMKSELHGKEKLIKNLKDELTEYRNASLSLSSEDESTITVQPKKPKAEDI